MRDNRVIIYTLWHNRPGGLEKVLEYYLKDQTISKNYKQILYFLRPSENKNHQFFKCNIKKIYGSSNNAILWLKLFSYLLKNRSALYHLFNCGPVILLIFRLAGIKKIIYHIHGTIYWKKAWQKPVVLFLWHLALWNYPGKILANSKFSKSVFTTNFKVNQPVYVLYNPFPVEKYHRKHIIPKKRTDIFYVGRLVEGKNLYLWIDIAKYLSEKLNNVRFHIYGSGPLFDKLEDYIVNKNLSQFVFMHGFVKNIEEIYRKHDLLLFLSEYESFGNVIVESILSGVPVLVSDIPSHMEILSNFPEYILNMGDDNLPDRILNKIKNLRDLYSHIPVARKQFSQNFSIEHHRRKLLEHYEQL